MTGSTSGLCWFEGTTDSFGPELKVLVDGLSVVPGSFCPHHDAEDDCKPLFHQAILDSVAGQLCGLQPGGPPLRRDGAGRNGQL
jgi:hypothetical protein